MVHDSRHCELVDRSSVVLRAALVLRRPALVEVPHDELAVARAGEDLVIEGALRPAHVRARAVHLEPAAVPHVARSVDAVTAGSYGELVLCGRHLVGGGDADDAEGSTGSFSV